MESISTIRLLSSGCIAALQGTPGTDPTNFYHTPYGGAQKIKGRSPVPPTGSIIEPHTDKFPDIFYPLFSSQNLSVKFLRRGYGGLKYSVGLRYPIGTMRGIYLGCELVIEGKERIS